MQDMNFHADTTSGEEGVALFRAIRERHPDLPVILLTAWTHLESAVDLVKAGAADYLAKPWDDRKLLATVENLLELARGAARTARGSQRRASPPQRTGARVRPARPRVRRSGERARARARLPGRARRRAGADHRPERRRQGEASPRSCRPTPRCGTGRSSRSTAARCRRELIEAELFGAEAGAYTGANSAREGKFEAADGGTLFLDEIGNLPLAGQVKLLRVLETGRFERLGGNRERQVKVRVISATNADLRATDRARARFREDLYYRLNVIELRLPPLARAPRRHPAAGATTSCRRASSSATTRARALLRARVARQRARAAATPSSAPRCCGRDASHRRRRPRPAGLRRDRRRRLRRRGAGSRRDRSGARARAAA